MSKGSRRRPEDSAAIARNWPLGRAKPRNDDDDDFANHPATRAWVQSIRAAVDEHVSDRADELASELLGETDSRHAS